jgi:membrane fusion protein (multidrug efflux system)
MNESESGGETEKSSGENDESNSGQNESQKQKPKSLTYQTANGVTVQVSVQEGKKDSGGDKEGGEGSDEKDSDAKDGEKKDGDDKDSKDKKGKDDKNKKPPIYKKPAFIITTIIVAVVLIVGVIILWLILRQYVSTNDAYIDGHVTQVSPRASAQVIALHIDDNQFVHQGDLLIELDPTDYELALAQAQAQAVSAQGRLEQAAAQTNSANAEVVQATAQVDAAEVEFGNATRDLGRYQNVDARARSQQQLDNAFANQKNMQAQLEEARAKLISAQADTTTSGANVKASAGEMQTAQANLHRAQVNLSYCKIFAATDGRVTQRTVEVGNYVTIGEAMFLLVDPNVWVTANFKETQLAHMQPGQPVTIKVDAFPGIKFRGHVDSIQAGSGSRFGVLPAENATGNYVKIVQRVPVKIVFEHDANTNDAPLLSPGLSVEPRVKVR